LYYTGATEDQAAFEATPITVGDDTVPSNYVGRVLDVAHGNELMDTVGENLDQLDAHRVFSPFTFAPFAGGALIMLIIAICYMVKLSKDGGCCLPGTNCLQPKVDGERASLTHGLSFSVDLESKSASKGQPGPAGDDPEAGSRSR